MPRKRKKIRKNMSRLKKTRIRSLITQGDLAEMIGIDQSAICSREKKGLFDIRVAKIYAKALECDPLDILEL